MTQKLTFYFLLFTFYSASMAQITTSEVKVEEIGDVTTIDDKVGIGMTNPTNQLSVQSGAIGADVINGYNSDGVEMFEVGTLNNNESYMMMWDKVGNGKMLFRTDNGRGYWMGNLGLGIDVPSARLHIEGVGSYNTNAWFGQAFVNNSVYHFDRARVGISGASSSGQYDAGIHFQVRNPENTNYYHAIIGQSRAGLLTFETGGAGVNPPSVKMVIMRDGRLGVGTTSPAYKLDVNGSLNAQSLYNSGVIQWSDFVFEKQYKLPTLTEVERHIQKHGHLKDIPSEEDVIENGYELGNMDAKLLQKIEELTLYVINLNKENKKLEERVEVLSNSPHPSGTPLFEKRGEGGELKEKIEELTLYTIEQQKRIERQEKINQELINRIQKLENNH